MDPGIRNATSKLIGSVCIEEKNGNYLVKQQAEIGGISRTILIEFDHSVTLEVAKKACLEKFEQMSQDFQSKQQDQRIEERTLAVQTTPENNQPLPLMLMAKNVLEIKGENDPSVNKSMLADFLKLEFNEQQIKLQDKQFLSTLKKSIQYADQKEIWEEGSGDTLFHRLLRSEAKETRLLALICLDSGVNVNSKNKREATGLHFAVLWNDEALAKTLLDRGAEQLPNKGPPPITPVEMALKYRRYSLAIQLLLADPGQKINGILPPACFIEEFIGEVKVENIFNLLEAFSKNNEINNHAETLWRSINESIHSIFGGAEFDKEMIVCWLLDHHVESESSLNGQYEAMNWLASRMYDRKLQKKGDLSILEKLIDHHVLPSLMLESHELLLFKIYENQDKKFKLDENLKNKIENLSKIKAYANLNELILKFNKEKDLTVHVKIFEEIEKSLENLKNENFQGIKYLEATLKINLSIKIKEIQEYRRILTALKEESEIGDCSNSIIDALISPLIENKQWDWLLKLHTANKPTPIQNNSDEFFVISPSSQLYEEPVDLNKIAFHFLLDKLVIKERKEYEGSSASIAGRALIQAINRLKANLPEETSLLIEQTIDFGSQNLVPMIQEFVELDQFGRKNQELVRSVTEKLQNLKEGASLLIPLGVALHGTCLLVTNTGNQEFQITHYNTGLGVNNHYKLSQSFNYQTFEIISGIPANSINHEASWKLLFKLASREDMDHVYQCITHTVGKGGKREAPSENEEDYEAIQLSGTCGMQSLLAFLRHQIMLASEGSPSEKEALYKIIKALMFTQFHKDNLNKLDRTIQKHSLTVINKFQAENEFIQIAKDPEAFKVALQTLTDLLEKAGQREQAELFRNRKPSSILSCYATLRQASLKLCLAWLKNPENPPPENLRDNKNLQLAFAKFEHYSATINNAKGSLKKHLYENKEDNYIQLLFQMLLKPPFHEFGIEMAAKLDKDKLPWVIKILNKFHNAPSFRGPWVKEWIHRLKSQEKNEMIEAIEQHWEKLENPNLTIDPLNKPKALEENIFL